MHTGILPSYAPTRPPQVLAVPQRQGVQVPARAAAGVRAEEPDEGADGGGAGQRGWGGHPGGHLLYSCTIVTKNNRCFFHLIRKDNAARCDDPSLLCAARAVAEPSRVLAWRNPSCSWRMALFIVPHASLPPCLPPSSCFVSAMGVHAMPLRTALAQQPRSFPPPANCRALPRAGQPVVRDGSACAPCRAAESARS